MASQKNKVTAPGLEQFVIVNVKLAGVTLGAGAYGSVEEVEIPGAKVAAKKLHTELIKLGSPQQVHKWVTDFVEECKLMSQLRHPHIVQFLGVCYLPGSPIPVLLMEKLQTSLDNLLETSPNIPLDVKVHLLTGTARGMVYLHSHTPPIAHRDLTARNILVDSGLTAKIADLGVARMVNIQPGQLAATMTQGPGNNLYMPPETVQEEGVTRYNAAIDIFSFGVVSLFTFTQTFPKDLKPHTYFDQTTQRLMARSEIERREDYVQLMKAALGEDHSLVSLTLGCLEFQAKDRPTAIEVVRMLEEVGRIVSQISFQKTKLELIQQNEAQIFSLQSVNNDLQANKQLVVKKQAHIDHLEGTLDCLRREKVEEVGRLEEMTTHQQQQLAVQRREIKQLSSQLRSLQQQSQKEPSQGSKQRDVSVASAMTKKSGPMMDSNSGDPQEKVESNLESILDEIGKFDLSELPPQTQSIDKEKLKFENGKSINILVTGKTGSGKSTLINALNVEEERQAKEGHTCTSTVEASKGKTAVRFWDCPAPRDGSKDQRKYLKEMKEFCSDRDLTIYCCKMADTRLVSGNDEVRTMKQLTKAFGPEFWTTTLIVLTFANVTHMIDKDWDFLSEEERLRVFESRIELWKAVIRDVLTRDIGVPGEIVQAIGIVPAGYYRMPHLPGYKFWLSNLWVHCLCTIQTPEAQADLIKLSQSVRNDNCKMS